MFAFKAHVALASSLVLLSFALPVQAQLTPTPSFEFWGSSEFQMTLSPETDPNLAWHDIIPDRFRIYTEHQFAHDLGLQQTLWRMGPIWNLLPFLTVAMHITSSSFPSSSSSAFNQEVRFELEPTFKGEFLPELRWSNRTAWSCACVPTSIFGVTAPALPSTTTLRTVPSLPLSPTSFTLSPTDRGSARTGPSWG